MDSFHFHVRQAVEITFCAALNPSGLHSRLRRELSRTVGGAGGVPQNSLSLFPVWGIGPSG